MPQGVNSAQPHRSDAFFQLADESNSRVTIGKGGQPQVNSVLSGRTRSGSVLRDSIASAIGLSGSRQQTYERENGVAHSQFARTVREDYPEYGSAATNQLKQKAGHGHRLTPSDILFVKKNLVGLEQDPQQARQMQQLFEAIGQDPRFQAILQNEASALTVEVEDEAFYEAQSKALTAAGTALGVAGDYTPVLKNFVSGVKMVKSGNAQGRLESVANALGDHRVDNKLGKYMAKNLASDHEQVGERAAIKATASVVMTGVEHGGVIDAAIAPITSAVASAVQSSVLDNTIDHAMSTVVETGMDEAIEQPAEYLERVRTDIVSLPRIEVMTDSGYKFFDMDERGHMEKLLTYLSAPENKVLTDPDTPALPGMKEGEQARLQLKQALGSSPQENIDRRNRTEGDKTLLRHMGNGGSMQNFMSGMDTATELPLDQWKVYNTVRTESLDNGQENGKPSALRLLSLAAFG